MLKNAAEVGVGMPPQSPEAIGASAIAALQQRVNAIIDSEMRRLIQRIPLDRSIRLEIAESLMQTTVALLRSPMTKVARQGDYPGRRNLVHYFAVLFDIKVEPQRPYRL